MVRHPASDKLCYPPHGSMNLGRTQTCEPCNGGLLSSHKCPLWNRAPKVTSALPRSSPKADVPLTANFGHCDHPVECPSWVDTVDKLSCRSRGATLIQGMHSAGRKDSTRAPFRIERCGGRAPHRTFSTQSGQGRHLYAARKDCCYKCEQTQSGRDGAWRSTPAVANFQ